FSGQRVARERIGPRPAAAADSPVFADAALAFQPVAVAQALQQRRVLIDIHHRLLRELAAADRHESAGIDAAGMADEEDTLAVVDADGRALDTPRQRAVRRALRITLALDNEPAVVMRLRRLDGVGLPARMVPQLLEYHFVLFRGDALFGQS